jgi:type IV pilus assembly protein PilY1
VKTYVIDVYQDTPDEETLSSLWYSTALVGGGQYFVAGSEQAFIDAINATLGDILSVSSSFTAVALPLSATNSSRRDNEVYIGMFRPAPGKSPRWFGNLKRYQLALFNGLPALADVNSHPAINNLNGFATECAESYWTSDTTDYWGSLGVNPVPQSLCQAAIDAMREYSDLPDGPFVEKGGVGQMIRELPRVTTSRNLLTVGEVTVDAATSDEIVPITDSHATDLGSLNVLNYLRGTIPGVGETMPVAGLRASSHGDVVHSRPLTIRYDDATVRVLYGANDGLFRSVDTASGEEKWAFLAPEHFSRIQRLYDNTPLVLYEGASQEAGLVYSRKDYFFDGPMGQLVTYEDPDPDDADDPSLGALVSAYIFPTMRRGGRMVYGLDVTDPDDPELLWRQGCPNLDNNLGCSSAGFTALGQTWSAPEVFFVEEYPGGGADPEPLLVMGGGFDDCLNEDQSAYPSPECDSANGKGVYVLNAVTGELLEVFPTDAPVITGVAPVDLNNDGFVDLVYLADVAGGIYRIRHADLTIDLTDFTDVPDGAIVPRDDSNTDADEWLIEKIAMMPGNTRRFYNAPTVGIYRGQILITLGSGDPERPLEANYPWLDDVQNRFYVLVDSPYDDYVAEFVTADPTYDPDFERRVVDLEGDTMYEVGTVIPDGQSLINFDGWYMDLPDRGEQVANPAAVGGGKVLFSTFQPGGASDGICERPLGIGKNYAVNLFAPEPVEGSECAGGGFCIPPIIETVEDIYEGCAYGEDCDSCVEGDPECSPPCDENGENCGVCDENGENCDTICDENGENCKTITCDENGENCTLCDESGENCVSYYDEPTTLTVCIVGGFDVCKLDPDVDPIRGRTFFTEDIDR